MMNAWCHRLYIIDATNAAARRVWWEKIHDGLVVNGVNNFFLDSAEPVQRIGHPRLIYSIGPQETVGMIYPLYYGQLVQEGLQSDQIQGMGLIRSAWAGSQRTGAAVWSGDTNSTFEELHDQVRAGLNMGLSGIVWWTTDIGGYQNGDIYDPYFQELIVRWFQWGAFCPIFRAHGIRTPLAVPDTEPCARSGSPNEIWDFGDVAYDAIKTVISIREQLRPYIYEQMQIASSTGTPVMRPLWFDFPSVTLAATIEDQFMFGPKYMVAPVIEYLARSRSVYFPLVNNSVWVHWFTKETYQPGLTVLDFSAPLDTFPLFYLRSTS